MASRQRGGRERCGGGMAYAARAFVVSLNNIYNAGQVLAIDFAWNSPRESIWKCDRI